MEYQLNDIDKAADYVLSLPRKVIHLLFERRQWDLVKPP